MLNEDPRPHDKGILRKIRGRSQESILLEFFEWLVPWKWGRIIVRVIFTLVVIGLLLLWLADFGLRIFSSTL
jgi:hypothetical protein